MTSGPSKPSELPGVPPSAATPTPAVSLLGFFLLTYGVTWTCFISVVAAAIAPRTALRAALVLLGTFAPSLVALGFTARAEGGTAVRALVRRVVEWRVRPQWYLFAVGYMAAVKLLGGLIHRLATGGWPRFGDEAWYLIAVAIIISTPFQAGEEIGWRGYALPRLAARLGLARASVLLGVIWGCWHLPLFFLPGIDKYGQSFWAYVLQVTALSVAIAWLYAHTNGSLLLSMLMHSAINQTKDIVPSAVPTATNPFALSTSLAAWLTLALLWIAAWYFLVRMPTTGPQRPGRNMATRR